MAAGLAATGVVSSGAAVGVAPTLHALATLASVLPAATYDGVLGGIPQNTEIATVVGLVVTASFPFYLYGAWIVIDAEVVTWSVLVRHLKYITTGLALTTIPVVGWMVPRLLEGFTGTRAVHVFFGLQAYAFLLVAFTGIVHIFKAKREHSLYEEPDQDVDLDDLHENMGAWRFRLRIGVFGYLLAWIVAWVLGMVLLWMRYKPFV